LNHLQKIDRARHRRDELPLHGHAQRAAQHREHVVHGLGFSFSEGALESLDVLVGDLIEPLVAQTREQVVVEDPLLAVQAAGLLPVGLRVVLHVLRLELLEGRDLLSFFFLLLQEGGRRPHQELAFLGLAPSLRGGLRFDGRLRCAAGTACRPGT
jgi:hypothetical protein